MILESRLALAAGACFATACVSAPQTAAADQYVIDKAHTHVQFSVQRFGFNDVIGFFPELSGVITLDEDAPENSSVSVEIDVASLVSGNDTRNEHLASEFWFNTGEYPVMTFQSTQVERTGETSARVTGDLMLLGVTHPVTLDVVMNKLGEDPATKKMAAGFSAITQLKRSTFGMTTAAALIGDDVAIRIETLAHKTEAEE